MPSPAAGRAAYQPIWAEDVADCVLAALDRAAATASARYELAGPEMLTHDDVVRLALRRSARRRPLVPRARCRSCARALRAVEALAGPAAFATWDEAELLEVSMTSARGTADAERARRHAPPMAAVLGVGLRTSAAADGRAHGPRGLELRGERQQRALASGWPTIWTPAGSPSRPWHSGTRDRRLAGDVERRA